MNVAYYDKCMNLYLKIHAMEIYFDLQIPNLTKPNLTNLTTMSLYQIGTGHITINGWIFYNGDTYNLPPPQHALYLNFKPTEAFYTFTSTLVGLHPVNILWFPQSLAILLLMTFPMTKFPLSFRYCQFYLFINHPQIT